MDCKVKTAAVIGAGVSGIASALHLKTAGLDVTVYERSASAGGVWTHDPRKPLEPNYPAVIPSLADFLPSGEEECFTREKKVDIVVLSEEKERAKLLHAPPGPAYDGLKANVSAVEMELKNQPWPPGTEEFASHRIIKEYLQGIADRSRADEFFYNTKVERLWKEEGKWQVKSKTLTESPCGELRVTERIRGFDAVVVASGHYHAPKVPDTRGLAEWKEAWPDRVQHAKGYRTPHRYKDQNVLLIGAGTTSFDIARELGPIASKIYQSSRGGSWDLPATLLPPNGVRIGEVESFNLSPKESHSHASATVYLEDKHAIPGTVTLKSGTTLSHIHSVIICTGYHFSLPFLSNLHADTLPPEKATPEILVTADGTQMHNLHLDIFYIPDPTLAFVGVPFYTATFTLFEFQAIAVSRVFSGKASLPTEAEMRKIYEDRKAKKGFGRAFHSLKGEEIEYVNGLVEWVNRDGARLGGVERVQGHSDRWLESYKKRAVRLQALLGIKVEGDGREGGESGRRGVGGKQSSGVEVVK